MNDILDLIDGAIDAHELSADAMRWTPEPDSAGITSFGADASMVVAHDGQHYTIIDEVHEWINRALPDVVLSEWQETVLRGMVVEYDTRPVRGIISALPAMPEREPDLLAALTELWRCYR